MVRMKFKKDELDADELDVPYTGPAFKRYTGDFPRTGTILTGRITKMWLSTDTNDDLQLVILVVAEQNGGKLSEFNGLTAWEYLTMIPERSRRYQPFLMNFGLTTKDVTLRMDVESDDDNIGTPINKLGKWVVGSDDALCRFVFKRDMYNVEPGGDPKPRIDWDGWLPYDEEIADPDAVIDDEDDEDEEVEEEKPARRARSRPSNNRSAASSRAAGSRRRPAEPEPEDDEDEDVPDDEDVDDYDEDEELEDEELDDEDEPEPARPARRQSARPAARQSTRPAARATRPASRASSKSTAKRGSKGDEPPF